MFEAVPNRGVSLFPIEARLARTARAMALLAVRRVECAARPEGSDAKLEAFVAEVLNRKLEFSPLPSYHIVRACCLHTLGCQAADKHEDWDEFFCSELAAEALQQAGLLSDGFNSNDMLPKSFSAAAAASPVSLDSQAMPGVTWARELAILHRGSALGRRLAMYKKRSMAAKKAAKKYGELELAAPAAAQGAGTASV